MMRPSEFHPLKVSKRPPILRGMREGLAYAWHEPRILLVLGMVFLLSTFCFNFNVLLPVLAKQTLHAGPQTFGILSAFFGAGALVGALLSAALGRASLKVLVLGAAGFGLGELVLAPERSAWLASLLLFAIGVCFTTWTSNSNSIVQLAPPDHLRGRIVGLYYFAFSGPGPLGGLIAGWLTAAGGTELAFFVAGAAALAMTMLALRVLRASANRSAPPARERMPDPGRLTA